VLVHDKCPPLHMTVLENRKLIVSRILK
jgi:hypothetical protein